MDQHFDIDFINIGVPRAGTTWLFRCLQEHPQIFIPEEKDLDFFNKVKPFYKSQLRSWRYEEGIGWYTSHFRGCPSNRLKGEIGTRYFFDPDCPQLIHKHFPYVKLLVILRNPSDRLYSEYQKNRIKYSLPPLKEVVCHEKELVETGFYDKHLRNYLTVFPRENILVLLYEDINKNPRAFIDDVCEFLEVTKNFTPQYLTHRVNKTAPAILNQYLVAFGGNLKKKKACRKLLNGMKASGLQTLLLKALHKLTQQKTKYERMDSATRQILGDIYRPHNENLESLIGRELSLWK